MATLIRTSPLPSTPEALQLQGPLADGLLSIVARGEKQDPPATSLEPFPPGWNRP